MTFEEWWRTKDYPTRCKGNCMEAFNAGLHADVHTDNSKVIAELNDKLNNLASVAKVRLANWQKYADAYNETQELLDKQIEATYKVVEKLNKAKELVKALLDVFVYDLADDELDSGDIVYIERAEKFLKEKEND